MKTVLVIGLLVVVIACLVDVARARNSASSAVKKVAGIDRTICVDLDILREIESGGRCDAVSHAGARGPYQMCLGAWLDAQASLRTRGRDEVAELEYRQWVTDETVSRCMAWEYISRVLPRYLTARALDLDRQFSPAVPDSLDARLAAWNAGAATVRAAYAQSPANWIKYMPSETREFISRYHRAVHHRDTERTEKKKGTG